MKELFVILLISVVMTFIYRFFVSFKIIKQQYCFLLISCLLSFELGIAYLLFAEKSFLTFTIFLLIMMGIFDITSVINSKSYNQENTAGRFNMLATPIFQNICFPILLMVISHILWK